MRHGRTIHGHFPTVQYIECSVSLGDHCLNCKEISESKDHHNP